MSTIERSWDVTVGGRRVSTSREWDGQQAGDWRIDPPLPVVRCVAFDDLDADGRLVALRKMSPAPRTGKPWTFTQHEGEHFNGDDVNPLRWSGGAP
jgi:hypothetical protein